MIANELASYFYAIHLLLERIGQLNKTLIIELTYFVPTVLLLLEISLRAHFNNYIHHLRKNKVVRSNVIILLFSNDNHSLLLGSYSL